MKFTQYIKNVPDKIAMILENYTHLKILFSFIKIVFISKSIKTFLMKFKFIIKYL